MKQFFQKRWFLMSLTLLISGGLWLGMQSPVTMKTIADGIPPKVTTGIVLFLMAFTLDSRQLAASFRSPAPVVFGFLLNSVAAPLGGLLLMGLQRHPDFAWGLMAACSVPCTLAAASVWTRKAKGNDAVSLLITLTTNMSCFLVIPFWLGIAASLQLGTATRAGTGIQGALDRGQIVWELLFAVLVPILAGQIVRQVASLGSLATRLKVPLGVVAQSLILVLIFRSALQGGIKLQSMSFSGGIGSVVIVWLSCIAVHLAVLGLGLLIGVQFGLAPADRPAVALAGSQKTLPVGILIADKLATAGGLSFAVFPMLMYHASQLFIDTLVADRFAAQMPPAPTASPAAAPSPPTPSTSS